MGNAHFNSAMDQYVLYGGSTVKNCSTEYINGCTVWGSSSSSSYGTGSSSSSYSYSSYNYTPPSGQREQIWNSYGLRSWVRSDADTTKIETLKQACASVTYGSGDIWMSGAGDYNSSNFGMPDEAKCRAWTPSSSSSYSYSSYNYSSYYSSSASTCPTSLLGAGCHDMGNAHFNGAMDQYVLYGGSTVKNCSTEYINGCTVWGSSSSSSYSSYPSSAYSSYSYSSYDASASCVQYGGTWNGSYCQYSSSSSYSPASSASYSSQDYSAACAQAGGTWDGSYCQMPQSSSAYSSYYSSAAYSSPSYDPSAACSQSGGTWDGTACQTPNSSSSSSVTQNPAAAGWLFKGIINFFSR